ncbi:hypothetical protein [Nannocystis pusilla]|uniref:hypothetical protein n=1 Tax=Nannocystis pusilla TaxID=889268 RepID=UPI003B7C3271
MAEPTKESSIWRCDHCGAAHCRLAVSVGVIVVLLITALGTLMFGLHTGLAMLLWSGLSFAVHLVSERLGRHRRLLEHLCRLKAQVAAAYSSRNLLALTLCRLSLHHGFKAGLYEDPEARGWPVVSVALPQGEVTWHIPASEAPSCLPLIARDWDGHDEAERDRRLMMFVENDTTRSD